MPGLNVVRCSSKDLCGEVAARFGASLISRAIREKGAANVILATGASQFEMLSTLRTCDEVDWVRMHPPTLTRALTAHRLPATRLHPPPRVTRLAAWQ
jgi:hypothetical protein